MIERPLRSAQAGTSAEMPKSARIVRYASCAFVILGLWITPGIPQSFRVQVSLALVGYLVVAKLLDALASHLPVTVHDFLQMFSGMITLGVATLVAGSSGRMVLVVYPCVMLFYLFLSGRAIGAAAALVGSLVALFAKFVGGHLTWLELGMFASAQFTTWLIGSYMVVEQRTTQAQLDRLRTALRQVSKVPELEPTLESIVKSIRQGMDGAPTCILLQCEDYLTIAAPAEIRAAHPEQMTEVVSRRELNDTTALLHRLFRRGSVSTQFADPSAEGHQWLAELFGPIFLEAPQVALLPLLVAGESIGLLAVSVQSPKPTDPNLEVLEVYAEQAAIVIARAQAYEVLQQAAREREAADLLKSEFLSMVSHELRSPLSSVKGWVATLRRHWEQFDDERRLELLERAETNADELTRLIDQLLDFSRVEANRFELSIQEVPLLEIVNEIAGDLVHLLVERSIITDIPEDTRLAADPHALRHILVNLLTNAAKYSTDQSPIGIRARSSQGWVTISISDRGIGIAPEDQERIFERFVQVSAVPHRARRGTGIGLAIAKRFTEAHGGTISVVSRPGAGSTFSFTIPAVMGPERSDR